MLRMWIGSGLLALALSAALPGSTGFAQEVDPNEPGARESWPVAGSGGDPARRGWEAAKAGALLGLERLRADIQVLGALRELQGRLLEWNTELVASGEAPSSLEAGLCEAAEVGVWCDLLPATFGRPGEDG